MYPCLMHIFFLVFTWGSSVVLTQLTAISRGRGYASLTLHCIPRASTVPGPTVVPSKYLLNEEHKKPKEVKQSRAS